MNRSWIYLIFRLYSKACISNGVSPPLEGIQVPTGQRKVEKKNRRNGPQRWRKR